MLPSRKLLVPLVGAIAAIGLGAGPAGAIIGGQKVTGISDAPWAAQVLFGSGGGHHCSGSIIASQWVLTAGHCASSDDYVLLGSVAKGHGTKITSDRQVKGQGEDIALLHLSKPYSTTYAKVGGSGDRPGNGATVQIYGYGEVDSEGTPSDSLKTCTMKVSGTGSDSANDHVWNLKKGSGISHSGDSGGPAFYKGVIIGTDSRGSDSVKDYADITHYTDWIHQTIGD